MVGGERCSGQSKEEICFSVPCHTSCLLISCNSTDGNPLAWKIGRGGGGQTLSELAGQGTGIGCIVVWIRLMARGKEREGKGTGKIGSAGNVDENWGFR